MFFGMTTGGEPELVSDLSEQSRIRASERFNYRVNTYSCRDLTASPEYSVVVEVVFRSRVVCGASAELLT
jgi:hypothetical protein